MINFTAGRVSILYNILNAQQQRSVHRVLGSVSTMQVFFIIATVSYLLRIHKSTRFSLMFWYITFSWPHPLLCHLTWTQWPVFPCIPCSSGDECIYGQLSHLDHQESPTQLSPKYLSQIPLCRKYRQVIKCTVCNCLDSQDHLALPSQLRQHAVSDVSTWPYICTFILKINVIFSCLFLLKIRLMKATNLVLSQWLRYENVFWNIMWLAHTVDCLGPQGCVPKEHWGRCCGPQRSQAGWELLSTSNSTKYTSLSY